MRHNNRWPSEPPQTGYTRSTFGRRRLPWPAIIAALSAAGIAITVALVIVWSDSPARGAADRAAVVSPPSSIPGPPIPQPTRCGQEPTR